MEKVKHVTKICVCRELNKGEGARYAEGAQCEHFYVPLWSKGAESWVSWRLKMSLEGCCLTRERGCCSQRPRLLHMSRERRVCLCGT